MPKSKSRKKTRKKQTASPDVKPVKSTWQDTRLTVRSKLSYVPNQRTKQNANWEKRS